MNREQTKPIKIVNQAWQKKKRVAYYSWQFNNPIAEGDLITGETNNKLKEFWEKEGAKAYQPGEGPIIKSVPDLERIEWSKRFLREKLEKERQEQSLRREVKKAHRTKGSNQPWTQEEENLVLKEGKYYTYEDLAKKLGRTPKSIRNKWYQLTNLANAK